MNIIIPALLIASLFTITTLSLDANAQSVPDPPNQNMDYTIIGAGATFPFPLIDLWRVEYKSEYNNVNLNYQSIGSGGGIKQHIEKTINFAATDKPLSEAERALAPGTLHIPESVGGVVIAYNIPEIPDKGLKLTSDAVAGIFLGEITRWNDPIIVDANPKLDIPDKDIITVHRSDGSGTTFIFTNYLSEISSTWEEKIGMDKSVPWPIGIGSAGNEGVSRAVANIDYSIGYIELAYAFQTGMSYASIQNSEKSAFIEPTLASIAAASSELASDLPAAEDSWVNVSLVNAPGADSYPISSFTYLLVYNDLKSPAIMNKEQAKTLIHMIHWMITDGQQYSSGLLYVPLVDDIADIGKDGLSKITYDGEFLWDMNATKLTNIGEVVPNNDNPGCLIATATFGSELAPQVQLLREVRDNQLLNTSIGSSFMNSFNQIYYSFSPYIADFERENSLFKEFVKIGITPMISTLSIMSLAESNVEVLGYGLGVILLNIGLYIVAPIAIISFSIRKMI